MCEKKGVKLGSSDCMAQILSGKCIVAKNAAGCSQFTAFAKEHPKSGRTIQVYAETIGQFEGE